MVEEEEEEACVLIDYNEHLFVDYGSNYTCRYFKGTTKSMILMDEKTPNPPILRYVPLSRCKKGSKQGEGETSCHHITIIEEPEIETTKEDAEDAPQSLKDGGQSTIDELKEVNLGTIEEPHTTFISASLFSEEEAIHHLAIKPGYRSIKQAQRRFQSKLIPKIEVEADKLIEAGFIREVKYPTWIANIVLVRKKNGQLRVCVDLHDLNNACPEDDFPLPITEIMVDVTTGHEAMSFMDGSSRYNQIRMNLSNEEMTTFRTPKEIYCYKVMPFGLNNVGATYQRAMQKMFDDMLPKYVECYADDLMLRMNPLKCAFGVTSEKFLSFIVRHREIEIDQSKIDAIQKMPRPKSLHDLRSFEGRLAYIRRLSHSSSSKGGPYKAIKGQALVDFLADHPISSDWKLCEDLPDDEVSFTEVMEP
ncbi:uncharacterized protein E6C27_scaffold40G00310 [Cucumis melo var. makuwa]|uniref:Reverse transcriptase domain-containing protein n=1 Tax=Cucumis melo var. makuwa TaxID=1194695 RepID=A0A5A7VNU7_CUCMM|nr:uncharacterized protein E6C27_scaffold40G00310 [Cucumis melo var. makuwa]